ncbi:MAG: hypothetical protein KUG78_01265 [Kangiellaceae bacterium]|nr:hypothetical protein [Kangiellaceae bacterium]
MNEHRPAYFSVGEIAILQPPHPSAKHLWGKETTILDVFWSSGGEDAMGRNTPKWSYLTDIPAPPPTDLPEDQHSGWVWCEYDLRKRHQSGESLEHMIEKISDESIETS